MKCMLLAALLVAAAATAQEPANPLPGVETLQALRDGAAANQQLAEADRAATAAAYDEAARLAQQALDMQTSAAEMDGRKTGVAEQEKKLRADIDSLRAAAELTIEEGATLASVEPLLDAAESDYKAAQAEYEAALADPEQRAARRREIPGLQDAARQRERESLDALNAAPPAGEAVELTSARRVAAQARLEAARAELKLLDAELASFDVLNALVSVRQEAAKARLSKNERDLKVLREAAARLRREEAAAAAQKAADDLLATQDIDPAVREMVMNVAKENANLAAERAGEDGLAKKIEDTTNASQLANERLASLRDQWNNVTQRVSAGGFSDTVGVLLRKQRADLPSPRALEAAVRERSAVAASMEILQGDKRQQRLALGDVEDALDAAMKDSMADLSQYEKQRISAIVRKLVDDQRALIDALTADYFSYVAQLEELNRAERELARVSREFGDYISENVLWIRGTSPLSLYTLQDLRNAAAWALDPQVWFTLPLRLYDEGKSNPIIAGLQTLVVLVLIGLRRPLRFRLQAVGVLARSRRDTHFGHTIEALAHTFLMSLPVPAVFWLAANRIAAASSGIDQLEALAAGLFAAAWAVWPLTFARALFVQDGLADAHFDWSVARDAKAERRILAAGVLFGVPMVALCAALIAHGDDNYSRSLGCAAYLLLLLVVALTTARAVRVCGKDIQHDDPDHWFVAPGYRGKLARSAVPLGQFVFAGMALWGYYYTSFELATRAYETAVILFVAVVVSSAVRRWLLLERRRLAIEQARRKREAMRAEAEGEKTDARPEEELNILKVDAQSQAAIRIVTIIVATLSIFQVWSDMAPALNILQGVTLWNTVETIAVEGKMVEQVQAITLANAALSLLVIFVTVLAVKNLPGLIEIGLLQRWNMPAGERYATLAVVRYALTALGILLAFQAIGVGWGKVQWLVAALGVGLGFGLQEIFANFISGLILLFERPIRVGDVITIGGTSGTVSQIRIRATTVTDFDNKDLVVPNKEFVTGQLLNWTLNSSRLRIVIPVGIAYGADVQKAVRLLLSAAMEHRLVSQVPEPAAIFVGFGDSALNLELRCFCDNLSDSVGVRHDLLLRINNDFNEAGVEIAFPQREIHVRGAEQLIAALNESRDKHEPKPPKI